MRDFCVGSRWGSTRHNCLVVYRRRWVDLWRKTYWVVCIYCDQMQGPHREQRVAQNVADAFNQRED